MESNIIWNNHLKHERKMTDNSRCFKHFTSLIVLTNKLNSILTEMFLVYWSLGRKMCMTKFWWYMYKGWYLKLTLVCQKFNFILQFVKLYTSLYILYKFNSIFIIALKLFLKGKKKNEKTLIERNKIRCEIYISHSSKILKKIIMKLSLWDPHQIHLIIILKKK